MKTNDQVSDCVFLSMMSINKSSVSLLLLLFFYNIRSSYSTCYSRIKYLFPQHSYSNQAMSVTNINIVFIFIFHVYLESTGANRFLKRTFFHPKITACEEHKREAREDYGRRKFFVSLHTIEIMVYL